MVMATDVSDAARERRAAAADAAEAMALHERLVAHVRGLSGEDERGGVWGEHSYARARAAPPAALRALLAPPPAPVARLDVLAPPAPAPALPDPPPSDDESDERDDDDERDDNDDEQWEERLCAGAPGAAHARLVRAAAAALHGLRLERAAAGRVLGRRARRDGARQAAQRLRRALAPCWGGAAGWLLDALPAALPRALRRLLDEALSELRRAAPRLAARLPPAPAPPLEPLDTVGPAVGAEAAGPWLAWAPSGCGALDERWARRLGALLHTRRLAGAGAVGARAAPDRWCAALAAAARGALGGVLAEAGARPVVLGGAGAGAALAAWLAADGGARALLQLAPPQRTAEGGAAEGPALPALLVLGGAGGSVAAGGTRRVLRVAGADEALRLPRRLRARLALPQHALDAAVAEECARWAADVTDPAGGGAGGARAIEIVEGRVVARGSGGAPLPLPAPRRAEPALAAADIMQLPIVFADDEPLPPSADASTTPPSPPAAPAADLTVTSGNPRRTSPSRSVRYTRVLVAKRAPRRGPGRPPLRPTRPRD